MEQKYNWQPEKEAGFLKHSEDYLRAVQERIAAFFMMVGDSDEDIKLKVEKASNLWYDIVVNEAKSLYSIIYQKGYKNDDANFIKRKGYRSKNQFAFDLITNWVFERMIIPVTHTYSGLNCEPFYLNPETCDNDAKLGWEANISNGGNRKINSKYDFLTKIDGIVHNIEIKSMFVHDKRSANFKVFFTPDKNEDLEKYHVLFFNFNGLGNPKSYAPSKTKVELFYIPWTQLSKSHIHYPPQIDGKPCYLVHLYDELLCEQCDINGKKTTTNIGETKGCFHLDKPILQKVLRYDDLQPYLTYSNKKFLPNNILKMVQKLN